MVETTKRANSTQPNEEEPKRNRAKTARRAQKNERMRHVFVVFNAHHSEAV